MVFKKANLKLRFPRGLFCCSSLPKIYFAPLYLGLDMSARSALLITWMIIQNFRTILLLGWSFPVESFAECVLGIFKFLRGKCARESILYKTSSFLVSKDIENWGKIVDCRTCAKWRSLSSFHVYKGWHSKLLLLQPFQYYLKNDVLFPSNA